MFFDELSNEEWARLAALVTDEPIVRLNRRGRPRAEPRVVANAVLWILTTGEPWSKLPGRYPSGPTCRRRFEEWQLNGTLAEMVRILSGGGRRFAYVPEPVCAEDRLPPEPVAPRAPVPRDDGMRGVFWKSPEAWQTPQGAIPAAAQALDPLAAMTRQLAGEANEPALSAASPVPSAPVVPSAPPVQQEAGVTATRIGAADEAALQAAADEATANEATVNDTPANEAPVSQAAEFPIQPPVANWSAAADVPTSASAGEAPVQQDDGEHNPLWMSLCSHGRQIADRRGYVVYVAAEAVQGGQYRAWAEIMRDGRRIERSGLVGPRFDDAQAAERYAIEWADAWIERANRASAATTPVPGSVAAQPAVMMPLSAAANAPARALPPLKRLPGAVQPTTHPAHAPRRLARPYPGEFSNEFSADYPAGSYSGETAASNDSAESAPGGRDRRFYSHAG